MKYTHFFALLASSLFMINLLGSELEHKETRIIDVVITANAPASKRTAMILNFNGQLKNFYMQKFFNPKDFTLPLNSGADTTLAELSKALVQKAAHETCVVSQALVSDKNRLKFIKGTLKDYVVGQSIEVSNTKSIKELMTTEGFDPNKHDLMVVIEPKSE